MKGEIIIHIMIAIVVLILIILVLVVILNSMENKFTKDCAKQDYQGIVSYWDVDINCSQIKALPNRIK